MNDFTTLSHDGMHAAIKHNMQTAKEMMAHAERLADAALREADLSIRADLKAQAQHASNAATQLMYETQHLLQHYAASVQLNNQNQSSH